MDAMLSVALLILLSPFGQVDPDATLFTGQTLITGVESSSGSAAADLDGDGDLDFVFGSGDASWYENLGGPILRVKRHPLPTFISGQVSIGDADNDGDLDLVANAGNSLSVFFNTAGVGATPTYTRTSIAGTFTECGILGVQTPEWADLDLDGDLDIVHVSRNTSEIFWYRNDGQQPPTFTQFNIDVEECEDVSFMEEPIGSVVSDVNGDGLPDVVAIGDELDRLGWFRNTGIMPDGFEPVLIMDGIERIGSLRVADLDGDLDVDIIVGSWGRDGAILWFENDGNVDPTFVMHSLDPLPERPIGLTPADIDGDGDVDLVAFLTIADNLVWYENTGDQPVPQFTRHQIDELYNSASGIIPVDLDQDGDLDILFSDSRFDRIEWLEQGVLVRNVTTGQYFATIQDAIDVADDGQEILADPAKFYAEPTIDFLHKALTLSSTGTLIHGRDNSMTLADDAILQSATEKPIIDPPAVTAKPFDQTPLDAAPSAISDAHDPPQMQTSDDRDLPEGGSELGYVEFRLLGMPADPDVPLPTRDIVVGPDILGGMFLTTDTVLDLEGLPPLESLLSATASGGLYHVFLTAEVVGPSIGLAACALEIHADTDGLFETEFLYDVAFLDDPGRIASFAGFTSELPQERRMAGGLTVSGLGQFFQTFVATGPAFGVISPKGNFLNLYFANRPISPTPEDHTFGVGKLGQGQSTGPTIIGHFLYRVDPADPVERPTVHELSMQNVSASLYQNPPVFPGFGSSIFADGDVIADGKLTFVLDGCDAESCDDGSLCTIDACNPLTGDCMYATVAINDGDPCTFDACDPATGAITHTAGCDDGNLCTIDECILPGGCVNTPIEIDDGIPCTADLCDPLTGEITHLFDPDLCAVTARGSIEVPAESSSQILTERMTLETSGVITVGNNGHLHVTAPDGALLAGRTDIRGGAGLTSDGPVAFAGGELEFNEFTLPSGLSTIHDLATADLDGDGDNDLIAVASGVDDSLVWYENLDTDPPSWVSRSIAMADGMSAVEEADMDDDGDIDLVTAAYFDDSVHWHENLGGTPPVFATHLADGSINGAQDVFVADLDADGDSDIVVASRVDNTVYWLENRLSGGLSFTRRVVASGINDPWAVAAADIDQDGHMDVISTSQSDGVLAWHRNDGSVPPQFVAQVINDDTPGLLAVITLDIDHDGDMDIVTASWTDDAIHWYENHSGAPPTFTGRQLSAELQFPNDLRSGDIDGDGKVDLFTSASSGGGVIMFLNNGQSPPEFDSSTIVADEFEGFQVLVVADFDGDQNLDIASTFREDGLNPIQVIQNVRGRADIALSGVLIATGEMLTTLPIQLTGGSIQQIETLTIQAHGSLLGFGSVDGPVVCAGLINIGEGTLAISGNLDLSGRLISEAGDGDPTPALSLTDDLHASSGAAVLFASTGSIISISGSLDLAIDDRWRFNLADDEIHFNATKGVQSLEVMSTDIGPDSAGLNRALPGHFPLGTLRLESQTTLQLVDVHDNDRMTQTNCEALYVDRLIVEEGATLFSECANIYYQSLTLSGTVEPMDHLIPLPTVCAGDFDADGDIDLTDFGQFQLCFTGPGGMAAAGCGCADFDRDNDVDLVDFNAFQLAFTGA